MNLCIAISAYALWGILVVLALNFSTTKTDPPKFSAHERLFMELFVVALLLFRLPYLTRNWQINGDEGQMLAQGMKYLTDPIPWRSVDGTTNGPLDTYVLMWPALFHLAMNYCSARITGVLLITLSVFFSQRLFRLAIDARWSLILVMPMVTMYLFAFEADFVHYSSELVSVPLLSALGWAGFALYKKPTVPLAVAAGLIAGAVPLAKIQAFPIALSCFLLTLGALISRPDKDKRWRNELLALLLCTLIVPLSILVPVIVSGAWGDFWIRYIVSNATYHSPIDHSRFRTLMELLVTEDQTAPFNSRVIVPQAAASLLALAQFTLTAFIIPWRLVPGFQRRQGYDWHVFAALLLVVAASFAILKSNFPFPHYLHLMVLPLSALAAVAIIPIECAIETTEAAPRWRGRAAAAVAAICLTPPLIFCALNGFPLLEALNFPWAVADSPIIQFLKGKKIAGDRLAVWGWHPELYVYCGMTPATRDALSFMLFMDGPSSAYYKRTFVEDMKRSRPRFFVDTVGEDVLSHSPATKGWPPFNVITPEKAPFISEYLKREYARCHTFRNGAGIPMIVVYQRKDSSPPIAAPD
jgi:hypothetical protein